MFLTLSCHYNKPHVINYDINGNPIITDEFKITFLNEVLDDTSHINFKRYNDPYIYITNVEGKSYPTKINGTLKYPTITEYLSITLKSKDTAFLRNQIINKLNNQKLINFGFKSINQDKLTTYHFNNNDLKIEYHVSEDSLLKVEKLLKSDGILYLSTPIFNKELNLAYMEAEHGPTGEHLVFEKENNKWVTKLILSEWIK